MTGPGRVVVSVTFFLAPLYPEVSEQFAHILRTEKYSHVGAEPWNVPDEVLQTRCVATKAKNRSLHK